MKISRSNEQWRSLVLQQQESGLSVAAFCREHELAPSSFYSSRARLFDAEATEPSKFVRAKLTQELKLRETATSAQVFEITLGAAKLSLPTTTSPPYLLCCCRG